MNRVRGGPVPDHPDADTVLAAEWLQGPGSIPGSLEVGVMSDSTGAHEVAHPA